MKLSNRINDMEFPAIRSLVPYEKVAISKGNKVYHLNIGSPDIETPIEYFNAIREYDNRVLGYSPANGILELRESISKYYKDREVNISEEDIIITYGASEALVLIMLTLADIGDEIITCNPFFSCYKTFADQAGVKIKTFSTYSEDNYAIKDPLEIEKLINNKTKAILLANPGNPTGTVYSKEEIEMIIKISIENDLYIIADEVYREYVYDDLEFTSFGEYEEIKDRLIITDSISKRFSACGSRIGAIISRNNEIISKASKLAVGRNAVSTIEQIGATALYTVEEKYYKDIKEKYEKRRNIIYNELNNIQGVTVVKPEGAFYIMATLCIKDGLRFAKWLLEEFNYDNETLMVAPGSGFYQDSNYGDNQIRMAYVLEEESILKSMKILSEGLKKYIEIYPEEVNY